VETVIQDSLLRSKYRECVFNWRKLVHEAKILEQGLVSSGDLGAFYRHVNRNIANRSVWQTRAKLLKINLICTTSKKRTKTWTINFF